MRQLLSIAGIIVLALGAAPTHAQLSPGTSGYSSAPTSASEAEYWIMVRRLGLCLADAKTDKAVAFLRAKPGSKAEDAAFDELFHRNTNNCMGNFVSASILRGHIRGSIAEGFVKMMPEERKGVEIAQTISQPETIQSIYDFADCYVANNPAEALQFLDQTKVGTKGEIQALKQMAVDFGPCLPDGFEAKLNPINIRMALAETLYHAAMGERLSDSRKSQ